MLCVGCNIGTGNPICIRSSSVMMTGDLIAAVAAAKFRVCFFPILPESMYKGLCARYLVIRTSVCCN